MMYDPQTDTDNETHSPWYECFEPEAHWAAQWAAEPETPEAPAPAAEADDDGAMAALFAYYNA